MSWQGMARKTIRSITCLGPPNLRFQCLLIKILLNAGLEECEANTAKNTGHSALRLWRSCRVFGWRPSLVGWKLLVSGSKQLAHLQLLYPIQKSAANKLVLG